jgi:hypothetical protein
MKNIHVLSTDKPSRLHESGLFSSLGLSKEYLQWKFGKNIYITSDEVKKHGDWVISNLNEVTRFCSLYCQNEYRKIILTTDQDLIKDGVQAIEDEFLEWFIENPSCEFVEVRKEKYSERFDNDKSPIGNSDTWGNRWLIIIPKKKSKQETLEEVAENYAISKDSSSIFIKVHKKDFINGAKWQQEQIGKSEFLQKLRATLSDAEARRLIFETFKDKHYDSI